MGEITDSQIAGQMQQITEFKELARQMLDFLRRFHSHLQELEQEHESSVSSTFKLNQFLFQYEQNLHKNYEKPDQKVFTDEVSKAVSEFPHQVQNPFKVMLRWLKFEILDLEAILEAIEGSQVMKRLDLQLTNQKAEDERLR